MPFGSEAATKFVKPGEVTGVFWESRAKYEEEVEKVKKLIQALDEIRARTMTETPETAETTLEWIRLTIDELIPSKVEFGLDVKLSLDRFNRLRKMAGPFTLKPEEVSRRWKKRGREDHLGSGVACNWSSVESLQVEGTGVKGELDLSTFPDLPELKKLDLVNCGLTSLSDLPDCPNMRELHISNNPGIDLSTLPTLPKLYALDISHSGISTLASLTTARVPDLTILELANNPGLALSTLPDCPKLTHLNIADCEVTTLEHLTATRVPALKWLKATGNQALTGRSLPTGHNRRVTLVI